MLYRKPAKFAGVFALVASLMTGCSEAPTAVVERKSDVERQSDLVHTYQPLACTNNELNSKTRLLTILGGLVSVEGSSISLPLGALSLPTVITIQEPVSNYREVDIKANDLLHFIFNTPVTVTIKYGGCSVDRNYPLKVFYWENGELLEDMNAVDNPYTKTMTFTTGHLSGYVIAN